MLDILIQKKMCIHIAKKSFWAISEKKLYWLFDWKRSNTSGEWLIIEVALNPKWSDKPENGSGNVSEAKDIFRSNSVFVWQYKGSWEIERGELWHARAHTPVQLYLKNYSVNTITYSLSTILYMLFFGGFLIHGLCLNLLGEWLIRFFFSFMLFSSFWSVIEEYWCVIFVFWYGKIGLLYNGFIVCCGGCYIGVILTLFIKVETVIMCFTILAAFLDFVTFGLQ